MIENEAEILIELIRWSVTWIVAVEKVSSQSLLFCSK